jgi:hypothetical protein
MLKKHLPLVVAIALPIAFIGILAVAIMLPSMRMNPQHDFVYVDRNSVDKHSYEPIYFRNEYAVEGDRIVRRPLNVPQQNQALPGGYPYEGYRYEDAPTLYYYSVQDDTTREISFEEAEALAVTPGPSSPDGYTVSYEYNSDGIFELFGSSGSNSGYVITKGTARRSLTGMVTDPNGYGGYDFQLIGWIK